MANERGQAVASETMRTLAFGSVGATYTKIGTAITNPSRMLKFDNFTDQTLTFSDDGVNAKFQLYSFSSFIMDEGSNSATNTMSYNYPANTQFWVLYPGSAPTVGQVNVSTWYSN